jgi:hypothetical protein
MKPITRDEIADFLAEMHASEGLGEPDPVMVDAVAHAVGALDLSIQAMPDSARLTVVTLATLAFTYGQNATAKRLAGWMEPEQHGDEWLNFDGSFSAFVKHGIDEMCAGKRPFPPLPAPGGPTT